ncbi:MAG: hypothetical protein WAQ07_01090 [Candidatus Omnitrophota bacterium]
MSLEGGDMDNSQQELKLQSDIKYFNTSIMKLVLLFVCTFGIYGLYWHYKNWKAIKDHTGEKISPFWRAFFWIFTCSDLFKIIGLSALGKGINIAYSARDLATFYILMMLFGVVGSKYDNQIANLLWVVGFFAVIPLVIVQKAVNSYNAAIDDSYMINDGFSWKSITVIVLGAILLILSIAGRFLPNPK